MTPPSNQYPVDTPQPKPQPQFVRYGQSMPQPRTVFQSPPQPMAQPSSQPRSHPQQQPRPQQTRTQTQTQTQAQPRMQSQPETHASRQAQAQAQPQPRPRIQQPQRITLRQTAQDLAPEFAVQREARQFAARSAAQSTSQSAPQYHHDGGLMHPDDLVEDEEENGLSSVRIRNRPATPTEALTLFNELASYISHARTIIASTPTQHRELSDSLIEITSVLFAQVSDLIRIIVSAQQQLTDEDEDLKARELTMERELKDVSESLLTTRKNMANPGATPTPLPAITMQKSNPPTPNPSTPRLPVAGEPPSLPQFSPSSNPSNSQNSSSTPPEVLAQLLGQTSIQGPPDPQQLAQLNEQADEQAPASPTTTEANEEPFVPDLPFLPSLVKWAHELAPRVKAASVMHISGKPTYERLLLSKNQLTAASSVVKDVLPPLTEMTWEQRRAFPAFQRASFPGTGILVKEMKNISDQLKLVMQLLGRVQITYNRRKRRGLLNPVPKISETYDVLKTIQNIFGASDQSHRTGWAVTASNSMTVRAMYSFPMSTLVETKEKLGIWFQEMEESQHVRLGENNFNEHDVSYTQKYVLLTQNGKLNDLIRIMSPIIRRMHM